MPVICVTSPCDALSHIHQMTLPSPRSGMSPPLPCLYLSFFFLSFLERLSMAAWPGQALAATYPGPGFLDAVLVLFQAGLESTE